MACGARPGGGPPSPLPLAVQPQVRFNPAVSSRDYLIPGLIAMIMTLTGALLTALVIAREWERGTMEALMVTRVRMREILPGQARSLFPLGMGGMAASVALAVFLFGVPLHGSILVLAAASALFMLAALGMGLLISGVARNQFVAGQIAIITTFLPAFILSGFMFDINSMPRRRADHHPYRRGALFRRHSAIGVPGRRRLVGDPAERRRAGRDGGDLPRPGARERPQAAGLSAMLRQVLALVLEGAAGRAARRQEPDRC